MRIKYILFLSYLTSFYWGSACYGQITQGNIRFSEVQMVSDTIDLGDEFIFPNSVKVYSHFKEDLISNKNYLFQDNKLIWIGPNRPIRIYLEYRVNTSSLFAKLKLRDSALISKTPTADNDFSEINNFSLIEEENISYSGSISRGISIGNRQDLVLNSALDLQLAGEFGDGIEIVAAFSDQNIPLQPEGNTQQLRDLDKVYIQITKDQHTIIAGDYELESSNSHFMKYYKKFQGANYNSKLLTTKQLELSNSASIAISKGKFIRSVINTLEGNQGPYRLQGADNETFIFIIAATERVYMDGILLKRGIEEDYTIDYNRAEITFTSKRIITKDKRLTIDFEYNNQDYLRTAYALSSEIKGEKFQSRINIYSEQDNKSSSGLNDLTADQKQFLSTIGDNLNDSFYSGITPLSIEENQNPITYIMKDSLVNGIQYDSVLVYSIQTESNLYSASFSLVGDNLGNYIVDQNLSNGTSYKWIAPIEGIPQGSFAPLIKLSSPKLQRLINVGVDYNINKNLLINSELAASTRDQNRYSKLDNSDNHGLGNLTQIKYSKTITTDLKLTADLKYEYLSQQFSPLNPYRNAEFNRDWNLESRNNQAEHFTTFQLGLNHKKTFKTRYSLQNLQRSNSFQGLKQGLALGLEKNSFHLEFNASSLKTETEKENTLFLRSDLHSYKVFEKLSSIQIGVKALQEQNSRKNETENLLLNSLSFYDIQLYLENPNANLFHQHISIGRRLDFNPDGKDFKKANDAFQLQYLGHLKNKKSSSNLLWNINYRDLVVRDSVLSSDEPKNSFLGRLTYSLNAWKGSLQSNSTYEVGSGQENKIRYTYLEVDAGQGQYQWVDYNQDSIQQITEFEVAVNIDQAKFARFIIPGNDYIQTNNVLFNQTIAITPKVSWQNETGWKKILSKFSSQSAFKISRKSLDGNSIANWNPFDSKIDDSSIISSASLIRNILYFNRGNPKFEFHLGQLDQQNKVILDIGSDSYKTREHFFYYQLKLNPLIRHTTDFRIANSKNNSSYFASKNYLIESISIAPKIILLFKQNVKANFIYNYLTKDNVLRQEGESLKSNSFELTLNLQKQESLSFSASLKMARVIFEADQDSPVAFQMLDGLRNGDNFIWNIQANQKLAKNLILSIIYDGRKNGNLKPAHIGNIALKASF